MIREFNRSDTERVMDLWMLGNMDAHPFIPREYWKSNFEQVKEQILQAEVYVYVIHGTVQGFIGMVNEYIAGIFVDKTCRSSGIGTQLLAYVKQKYDTLSLNVYEKNSRAAAFYQREGFSVLSEGMDPDTGEKEYTMFWKHKG